MQQAMMSVPVVMLMIPGCAANNLHCKQLVHVYSPVDIRLHCCRVTGMILHVVKCAAVQRLFVTTVSCDGVAHMRKLTVPAEVPSNNFRALLLNKHMHARGQPCLKICMRASANRLVSIVVVKYLQLHSTQLMTGSLNIQLECLSTERIKACTSWGTLRDDDVPARVPLLV